MSAVTSSTRIRDLEGNPFTLADLARMGKLEIRHVKRFGGGEKPRAQWFADLETDRDEAGNYAGSAGIAISARLGRELIALGAADYRQTDAAAKILAEVAS